jgi:hypothetical protein
MLPPSHPPRALVFGLILVGALACGCTFMSVPGLSLQGFRGRDRAPETSPPEDAPPIPAAQAAAPQTSPAPAVPPAVSPLIVAMQRAGSHYDRGVHAMRRGDADQAEWEFDAALENLLNTPLLPSPPAVTSRRLPSAPDWRWLSRLAAPHKSPPPPPLLPDGSPAAAAAPESEEPTLEAPALLGPEDLKAMEAARKETEAAPPLPEPDVRTFDFPVVFNDQVKTLLQYFQTRKWGVVTRAFERARRYASMMRGIFREKGLPEDLVNLAFIESAVNPRATSRVKAAGIWQFMPSTGRLYGMRKTAWLDERRDPEKSTRGAAAYLKCLYDRFGSWPLALAAYNAGEGTIQRAVQEQRTQDFWRLRLPKETKLFVPAFMAMTIIARDPERYGFFPPAEEPYDVDILHLQHPSDLRLIARAAGTSEEHLRELNPELVRGATPPTQGRYALRIPRGLTQTVQAALGQIPPAQRVSWISHKVRRGETPGAIAKHYRVSLTALLEMNELQKRQALPAVANFAVERIHG